MDEYNPADHTVDEVKAYVDENPEQAKAVLEAEKARGDDSRSTLVSHLEGLVEDQPEAPQPVSSSVTVEPSAAPGLLDQFEVTPERGYRRKG